MASTSAVAIAAQGLRSASEWWEEVNNSAVWQDWIFHALAGLFGIVGVVALIQLIRIECRVPEYGWTTQKVFHFLNFLVNTVRCVVFVFRRGVQKLKPEILQHILLDMPGLAFFTTYALLVLFWAEIYYQARGQSTDALRPSFYSINAVIYSVQIVLWLLLWWKPVRALLILSKVFFAGVSLFAALGFLLYGGRLFLMLQRFPVESKGRRKKLQEVGYVTTICFSCFLVRCVMMCFNAFDKAADLDVLSHPVLNFLYYLGGGGGGGISPSKLRLMLLGVEKRRKEEEELEARRSLRSEVPDVDDRCVGSAEACKDVGMVCSQPEGSTLRAEMASAHHPSKDLAVANAGVPMAQEDPPFDAESVSSSVFEFQRADRAQQHWPALVPPFGKPAPSKWDDAQKWIGSPTSNRNSKPSGAHPKRTGGGILGQWNRQCATKVLEITEEVDTKRIDPSQSKKEAAGQRTVSWVPDPYPVAEQCAKPIHVLESSVADSAVSLSRHDSSTLFNISTAFITPPSTVRSVSMRDTGTEMTPAASQEPSRTGTPVRATTPTRSPISSRPSSPGRIAPSSSPIHSSEPQENSSMKELSEKELQMKTRREIMVLGTQLGKLNIAAWASKEEEDRTASVSHETMSVDQSSKNIIEIRAAAWEEAEKAKYLARFKREEIKIQAWENHQKAKAEAEMRKIEVEVERMSACAHDKLMSKLAAARHKAEAKCAAAEARRTRQAAKTEQQAEYIRQTGRVPSSFSCWGWCE